MTSDPQRFNTAIVECPLDGLKPGTNLSFTQILVAPVGDSDQLQREVKLERYGGVLLSLHIQGSNDDDRWSTIEGSAVLVAPGLAITARHVLADIAQHLQAGRGIVFCIGVIPSGLQLWRVTQVYDVDPSDLSLLMLELRSPMPPDNKFQIAQMTMGIPAVGDRVVIAGFQASPEHVTPLDIVDRVPIFEVRDNHIAYGIELYTATGSILEHHINGRGGMLPGPAITTSQGALAGMSGGAAFDSEGKLFGIVSASTEHVDGVGPTFISLLHLAMALPITPRFMHLYAVPIRLIDMHPYPIVIDNLDMIEISGSKVTINWPPETA